MKPCRPTGIVPNIPKIVNPLLNCRCRCSRREVSCVWQSLSGDAGASVLGALLPLLDSFCDEPWLSDTISGACRQLPCVLATRPLRRCGQGSSFDLPAPTDRFSYINRLQHKSWMRNLCWYLADEVGNWIRPAPWRRRALPPHRLHCAGWIQSCNQTPVGLGMCET